MTVLGNKNSAQLAAQPDFPETTSVVLAAFAERSDLPEALREQAKTGIIEWTYVLGLINACISL